MLTQLQILLLSLVSTISVPICNCFHATRANVGKITTLGGRVPFFMTPMCIDLHEPWSQD